MIRYDEAREEYGQEIVDAIMRHDRHHCDEDGQPWWTVEDFAEAFELVTIERQRPDSTEDTRP